MTPLRAPLARYAERLHRAAGDTHHVASPLGAWLLLALTGPTATGDARAALAEVQNCPGVVAGPRTLSGGVVDVGQRWTYRDGEVRSVIAVMRVDERVLVLSMTSETSDPDDTTRIDALLALAAARLV